MERFILEQDIPVFYIPALTCPEGIVPAIEAMEARIATSAAGRIFYGVSGCSNGELYYWAAVNERVPGEGKQYGCPGFSIPRGPYLAKMVYNFRKDTAEISRTFTELLAQPGLQANGFCVEIYVNDDDVRCLVPLAE